MKICLIIEDIKHITFIAIEKGYFLQRFLKFGDLLIKGECSQQSMIFYITSNVVPVIQAEKPACLNKVIVY